MPAVWNCLNDDGGGPLLSVGRPVIRDNFCVGGKKHRPGFDLQCAVLLGENKFTFAV